jgi:hypothetical protein
MIETLITIAEQIEAVLPKRKGFQNVVADKDYHSRERVIDFQWFRIRSINSEPKRSQRRW